MSISRARSALGASENFEPSSEWVDEEGSKTLLVHLPGFKREQINALITSTGYININGERPLDGQRWSIFTKQYPLPEHCKVKETRAKFENETLHVRFYIDQDQVASPPVPTPTLHKSPSSPTLDDKAQERNGKSQKPIPEAEELQRKQKQPEAKKGNQEKKHETLQDKERSEEGKQPKATGIQEKKHETLQDKEKSEEGKQPKATEPKATGIQEKKHETLQDKEKSEEGKQPKATSNQEKKHETSQDKERSEEGVSNSDKKQGQQMGPALKTDDTSSLAKKQELPESSSLLGSNSKGTEMMEQYSTISLFMGLPPAKKTVLVNVAVAGLVLLGIGLYLTNK